VASKTATPSPLLRLRDGNLNSGKWTHQDAKTPRRPRNNFIVARENKIIPLSLQRQFSS